MGTGGAESVANAQSSPSQPPSRPAKRPASANCQAPPATVLPWILEPKGAGACIDVVEDLRKGGQFARNDAAACVDATLYGFKTSTVPPASPVCAVYAPTAAGRNRACALDAPARAPREAEDWSCWPHRPRRARTCPGGAVLLGPRGPWRSRHPVWHQPAASP
eukprot:364730-Chlamydomonas_euryale.AAC.7